MKTYKKIITVIFALALLLLNVNALADNGYSVKYSNNNSSVTVSVSDAAGEEVEILTDETLALKANGQFPETTSTGLSIQRFGSWSKGIVAANTNAQAGQTGFYNLPSSSAFQSVLSGDIEDYDLVVTFTKGASNAYIENIEIGLGNAKGTSGYSNLPTVVKTIALGDFGYTTAANGTEWTKTVRVSDILQNGNETLFPASGTPNELTGDNINLFAVKANYRIASTQAAQMIKFSSIKLVSHASGSSLPSNYALITAFYDAKGYLVTIDYRDNSPTITTAVPATATTLRSFLWEDINNTLRPIRPKFEGIIPIKRSLLFIGGRGAVDSAKKLNALAQAEGFDFSVDCLYYKGRELRDHWRNICTGSYDYELMRNGNILGGATYPIDNIISQKAYDIIVLEQSSGYAGVEDSVFPYIDYIKDYLNEKLPNAEIYYNTLWPFSTEYTGSVFGFYDNDPEIMKDMIYETSEIIRQETGISILNTNDIVYRLANVDGIALYQKESDTSFYRLNITGQAAVGAQILYSLTGSRPEAASITSAYSGVTSSNANKILEYLE